MPMLDFLQLPFSLPGSDVKISRDIAVDPIPLPVPTPGVGIPGITVPGTGAGSQTKPGTAATTGSVANVLPALAVPAMEALMNGAMKTAQMPTTATSGATGRSGDAFSQATFGDFIVGGSKGTTFQTILLASLVVFAGLVLLKTMRKK